MAETKAMLGGRDSMGSLEDDSPASASNDEKGLPHIDVPDSGHKTRCKNPFYHPPGSPRHFEKEEARNVGTFIAGIMLYKFAFESLNNCVALFAANRFPENKAVTLLSTLTAVFAVIQAVSSIAVAQLMTRFTTNRLLAVSLWIFGALVALIMIIEAASGGTLHKAGSWNPYAMFPIYLAMGGCLGILELIRRTIPRDIVGKSSAKLQRMDATVHIGYEVAGTAGAFASTPLISSLGYVFGLILLPFFFVCSGFAYSMLRLKHPSDVANEVQANAQEEGEVELPRIESPAQPERQRSGGHLGTIATEGGGVVRLPSAVEAMAERERLEQQVAANEERQHDMIKGVFREIKEFFLSLRVGGRIIFSSPKFSWLLFGYTLPLILHRLIENVLFPTFAKKILHDGALSGILLGASNFGELLGALFVLLVGQVILTPMPFVRWDGCMLAILWTFAFSHHEGGLGVALTLAPFLCLVSAGWAAGDVSLLAYIQSQLAEDYGEHDIDGVNPLGAVMGFLYSSYIILYTIISICVGRVFDHFFHDHEPSLGFFWVSGVFLSCCGVIIVASTFVPPGSWALNPKPQ